MVCTGQPRAMKQPSPLGEAFAQARSEGYFKEGVSKATPYHGYVYRLLKAQGPHAAGGAYDYMVRDKMLGGFALIASPAEYGSSGVMTFIVNHDGVVFSKDLGPDTAKAALRHRGLRSGSELDAGSRHRVIPIECRQEFLFLLTTRRVQLVAYACSLALRTSEARFRSKISAFASAGGLGIGASSSVMSALGWKRPLTNV